MINNCISEEVIIACRNIWQYIYNMQDLGREYVTMPLVNIQTPSLLYNTKQLRAGIKYTYVISYSAFMVLINYLSI
jgi:hypothetical protein